MRRLCDRCGKPVMDGEFGMKIRDSLYHLECFRCTECNIQLQKGQQVGFYNNDIKCSKHFMQDESSMLFHHQGSYEALSPPINAFGGHYDPQNEGQGHFSHRLQCFENNNEIKKRGRKKSRNVHNNGFLDQQGSEDGLGQVKTKRARTSFTQHQLQLMKNYFASNQNPDSRELKELSAQTCLDKKVLQVNHKFC